MPFHSFLTCWSVRTWGVWLLTTCAMLLTCMSLAHAQGFVVKEFHADIQLHEAGYFDVVETYEIEFTQPKHGIYRDMQLVYDFENEHGDVEKRRIKVSKIDVPKHKFHVNSKIEQRTSGQLHIRIGNPKKTVIGSQTYEIRYRVGNAMIITQEDTQLYWNVKPSMWEAPFESVSFDVHLPKSVELRDDQAFVYAGYQGDNRPSSSFQTHVSGQTYSGKSELGWRSVRGESVTVLVKMPRGKINEAISTGPPKWAPMLPIPIAILSLFGFAGVWFRFGKNEKIPVVTSYHPPQDIDPAMAGYMLRDGYKPTDLIALIPKWGAEGVLRLEEIPKKGFFSKADLKIIRLYDLPSDVPPYERIMFDGLFSSSGWNAASSIAGALKKAAVAARDAYQQGQPIDASNIDDTLDDAPPEVLVSSLKDNFYSTMQKAESALKGSAKRYYSSRTRTVMYMVMGIGVLLGALFGFLFYYFIGIVPALAVVAVAAVITVLAFFVKKRNSEGMALHAELQGFQQFIKLADRDRIAMLVREDPNYFEKTMSYALAFGLLKKWAAQFDALHVPPPSWYTAASMQGMSMNHFANSFSSQMTSAQSAMVSTPSSSSSSSGGGRSGGGFGGGGGGSW